MAPAENTSRAPPFRMNRLIDLVRALRVNQWTKNLVVLAAFCFAYGDRSQHLAPGSLIQVIEAFVAFCLASSGIYLLNDIRDLEQDRLHPIKRNRPLAAGRIPVRAAAILALLLVAAALAGAVRVTPAFGLVVGTYLGMQVIYTLFLKRLHLVDVFVIATGFVLRAAGGAVAIQVHISPWLLVCAFLLALFLALCKRRHEKILLEDSAEEHRASLEYYDRQVLDQLIAIVSAATIVSYSVYTLAPDTVQKFGTSLLSLTIPFVIFGIFRYLDLVYRRGRGGRPEKILLTDAVLIADILLYGLVALGVFLYTRHTLLPL